MYFDRFGKLKVILKQNEDKFNRVYFKTNKRKILSEVLEIRSKIEEIIEKLSYMLSIIDLLSNFVPNFSKASKFVPDPINDLLKVLKKKYLYLKKVEKYGLDSKDLPPRPKIPEYKKGEIPAFIPAEKIFFLCESNGGIYPSSPTEYFIKTLTIKNEDSEFRVDAEISFPENLKLPPINFRIPFFKTPKDLEFFLNLNEVDQCQFLRDHIEGIRIVPYEKFYNVELIYKIKKDEGLK